jgi:hypothetical protein
MWKRICFLLLIVFFFTVDSKANSWEDTLLQQVNTMADSLSMYLKPWNVPEKIFKVETYGAIADGKTLCTEAIQNAVNACTEAGGGVVLFSKGAYHTGTIYLKSNVMIQVDEAAVILGSKDHERDYPASPVSQPYINPETGFQYMNNPNPDDPDQQVNNANPKQQALFIAIRQENIGIRGKGKIDFRGYKWNPLYVFSKNTTGKHPFGIRMMECKNVVLQDIFLCNSNKWMQLYVHCENLIFDGIKVLNQVSFENDGLDLDACKNVIVRNSRFSTEDDGLCLKGMSGLVTENILIENCAIFSQCNAFKIGTDTEGDFRNILVRNCVLGGVPYDSTTYFKYRRSRPHGVDSGIALESVDGGITENIVIQGCKIFRANTPIFLRSGRRNRTCKQRPNPVHGTVRNILILDTKGFECEKDGSFISGIESSWITNVTIRNYYLKARGIKRKVDREIPKKETGYPDANQFNWINRGFPAYGFWIRNAKNIKFENVHVKPSISNSKRPCIKLAENTEDIFMDGVMVKEELLKCD